MRVLTQLELKRLTQGHLGELLRQIMNELPDLPEGSVERDNTLTTCATSPASWRGQS